ncbi:MAG: type I glyceraldehyde-3-phosphate dehydrogenase [Candidatus Tectomicrobia bacterium]|nr:type I glyceraldehyde-3-phosphate dehydrogenase [Candidatus Tectomicrobia bacterium]
MSIRVGVNGFGRIGRNLLRACHGHAIEIVGINDLAEPKTLAHLLKHDSNCGRYPEPVEASNAGIRVGRQEIPTFRMVDPRDLPWRELGASIVVESSGHFRSREGAAQHFQAGARKVIISAPGKNPDLTVVMGVNEERYDAAHHHIVSNASCTTNCLAPVALVLHREFGIVHGFLTTIHSYTNDQQLLDFPHNDLRRARAGAISMIPTTTGAARALAQVLPELAGKLDGLSVRVPTSNVSLIDLVLEVQRPVTVEEVNGAFQKAAAGSLSTILAYCDEPLVSVDFNHDPHSAIIDGLSTNVVGDTLVKVLAWYDNEWGYSCRLRDLIEYMVQHSPELASEDGGGR